MNSLLRYIRLPREMSAFEEHYLARMNRVALVFFLAHLPLFIAIAAINGTGPVMAGVLTLAVLTGPIVAVRSCAKRTASIVMGITAMFMGGILVHIGQGPMQIEMHFYFFVLLALLAVFANPMVVVVAALTAAVHHAGLWFLVPKSVFNYDAPIWVVAVHATFVVLESVAACYIARSFFDNVVELEKKVAARTAEVAARNRDMRMLLNAVDQGFFTVDRGGIMSDERSAAVDRWLGTPTPGITFPEFLRPHNSTLADWMALGLDDIFADIMPVEVTIDQLPKRFTVGERVLKLEYTPVNRDEKLVALAVVLSDISAQVARERLEAEHRVMMAMVERISQDKVGFLEFIQESEEIVAALPADRTGDLQVLKRKVHTLKGNSAIFGLELVAEACHTIEDFIAENGAVPEASAWELLETRWGTVRENLRRLIGESESGIKLRDDDYSEILSGILNEEPRTKLACKVAAWRLEPTGQRMNRIGEQARTLAKRFGKGEIDFRVRGGSLRLDPEYWANFWSTFIHVVRNAIDHGIETPEERLAAQKPETPIIEMATQIDFDTLIISIRDDGRGIAWKRIAELAESRNLPAKNHQDLVEALFNDGLSTSDRISELSGRGVGMAAIREACLELHGRIEVESDPGQGTTFRFLFPITSMAPATHALLSRHGVTAPEQAVHGTWHRPRGTDSWRINDRAAPSAL